MTSEIGDPPPGAAGAALYIASLVDDLARLAKRHNLEALALVLDMARLEAEQAAKSESTSGRAGPPGLTED
jgi:hypothetical protein